MRTLGRHLGLAIIFSFLILTSAFAEKRVALIIGNGEYKTVPKLPNPPNDANDMETTLKRLDFSVQKVLNGRYDDMRRALLRFARNARTADIALVFFAGHGIEVGGENWLIPTDAELRTDIDVDHEAISLRSILPILENSTKLGLIILDACRNNPFAAKMKRTIRTRAVVRGLAEVEPTGNVLVAYAAKDGTTAADGDGRNSPFTTSLLKHIEQPGMEINFLFRNVRDDVIAATNREQLPFVYGSLSRDAIYLKPPLPKAPAMRADEMAWSFLQDTGDILALRKFISQFPASPLAIAARDRIVALEQTAAATPKPKGPDEVAWNMMQKSEHIEVLRSFVQQFPSSPFASSARERIAALEQAAAAMPKPKGPDEVAWSLLRTSDDRDVLNNFMQRFPASPLVAAARSRIAALAQKAAAVPKPPRPDEIAWSLLQKSDDRDVLKSFVQRFPDSPHRRAAEARIASLHAPAATPEPAPPAPAVAAPPAVPLPTAAPPRPTLDPIAVELAFWNAIKDSTNPGEFESYLKRYPKGAFVSLAKLRLEELKKQQSRAAPLAAPAVVKPTAKTAPAPVTRAKADPDAGANRQPGGGRFAPGSPEARASGDRMEQNCRNGIARACQALQRLCQAGRKPACGRLRRAGR